MTNPLLQKFRTPYQAVPFHQIKNDHFIPALKKSIQIALNEIDIIVNQKEEPSFSNTLVPLDNCGMLVSRISSIIFNLNSAETSTELQQVSQKAAP